MALSVGTSPDIGIKTLIYNERIYVFIILALERNLEFCKSTLIYRIDRPRDLVIWLWSQEQDPGFLAARSMIFPPHRSSA